MNYSYESCDIRPWADEYSRRLQEAVELGVQTNTPVVVNLSVTHPRGFFPNQIIRRLVGKKLLHHEVPYISGATVPSPAPVNPMRIRGCSDLKTCKLKPWIKEIERREEEAKEEAYQKYAVDGQKHLPIVDLTDYHPRGGIPSEILKRIELKNDPRWKQAMESKIRDLGGEANQCEARANNMRERSEGVKDPTKLLAASAEQLEQAKVLRAQAAALKEELDATVN